LYSKNKCTPATSERRLWSRLVGMKNTLTPNEMLDKTLEWFAMDFKDINDGDTRRDSEHYKAERLIAEKFPEMDSPEFMEYSPMIFEQLVDDGYLTKGDNKYSINFKGKMFYKNGGYIKEQKRKSNATTLQSWQTWAIVVGTALAGIYALVEILKLLFSCRS